MNVTANMLRVEQAYDGELITEIALKSPEEVDAMIARAMRVYRDRASWLPAFRRIEILKNIGEQMSAQAQDLALLIAREGGKPLRDARVEVARAIHGIELAIEGISNLRGEQVPMDLTAAGAGRIAFSRTEPIGPVVAVSAFNHPLNLIVHQVAPAIATGCPVIVKPAGTTPLSCQKFVEMVHKAGLPEDWCQFCPAKASVAQGLITDPRTAFFTFIGSAKVGWYLRSKLAPGTRCALEHGGVAPVIVCDDADIAAVVPSLVKGGYYHAGQVCVSTQRIYVDNKIKADFIAAFKPAVDALITGDPTSEKTDVGPLIQTGEVDRVEQWVQEAVDLGAGILTGGARMSERVYQPTIVDEPSPEATLSTSEIFGPVTSIYGFDTLEQAIDRANALPTMFQSAAFTRDLDRAMYIADNLFASAVMINDHTAFRVDWMAFAGRGISGYGVGGIGHTMSEMVEEKLTVIKQSAL
jgi:acyl-CoA reductase-like NAD-dependent aldehyde dehydrogenase